MISVLNVIVNPLKILIKVSLKRLPFSSSGVMICYPYFAKFCYIKLGCVWDLRSSLDSTPSNLYVAAKVSITSCLLHVIKVGLFPVVIMSKLFAIIDSSRDSTFCLRILVLYQVMG